MFGIFRRTVQNVALSAPKLLPTSSPIIFTSGTPRLLHILSQSGNQPAITQSRFLQPYAPSFQTQNCGMKVKGVLRRRCKDCYFVRRQERLYVICETHPRHKQMSIVKKEKHTWMLSHATQSKVRPW